MASGMIFDVQRFSVHDGPGIRTTVFFKGCPLRCQWCHNPEGLRGIREISYLVSRCVACGLCVKDCPNHCHTVKDGIHIYDRTRCTNCGLCAQCCPSGALELIGEEVSASQVVIDAQKDRPFYINGGGITLSGGEPLFQPVFALEVMRLAKAAGLHVSLETCGFCDLHVLQETFPWVDLYLFDLKETDPQLHVSYTGVPLEPILSNLTALSNAGKKIILRCPIVPGKNDRAEHALSIASLANSLHFDSIELEPYHPLGLAKRDRFQIDAAYTNPDFAPRELVEPLAELIRNVTDTPVRVY